MGTESPIQLNDAQKQEWLRKRIGAFKKRYDALVAEMGLCHAAILDISPSGVVPMLLILPKNNDKAQPILDEITKPHDDASST